MMPSGIDFSVASITGTSGTVPQPISQVADLLTTNAELEMQTSPAAAGAQSGGAPADNSTVDDY